jgi:hypothetical protein
MSPGVKVVLVSILPVDQFPDRGEGFADEFLVEERPVDLGGVEERDSAVHGVPE